MDVPAGTKLSGNRLDGEETTWAVYSPVCTFCVHLRAQGAGRRCDAFPEGIPKVIWNGANPHTSPVAGDHGILFQLAPPMKNAWEKAKKSL